MVDIAGATKAIELSDFAFHDMGRDGVSETAAPAPDTFAVRPGEGMNGSDRVTFIWDTSGGAVFDTSWLRVTASTSFGLEADYVFYFGNAPGEGSGGGDATVDGTDEIGARNNGHGFSNPATVDDPWDYNKDRNVDGTDQVFARNNGTGFLTRLEAFTAPAVGLLSAELMGDDLAMLTAALSGGESGSLGDTSTGGVSGAAADDRLWSDADESKKEQSFATNWEHGVDTVLENDSLWLDDLWPDF